MFRRVDIGDTVVVLQSSYDDPSLCVRAVDGLYRLVRSLRAQGILSVRRSLDCVAMEYVDPDNVETLLRECKNRDWGQQTEPTDRMESLEVPVCYDSEFGKDLPSISSRTGLSVEQIVELHSSISYQVWMIGFMPGFPYMGRLPDKLRLERKSTPDFYIPAGSVALAEEYVGIYPFDSPGGWHLIGRTPWRIVDYKRRQPSTFDYGMNVRFVPIPRNEFDRLQKEA